MLGAMLKKLRVEKKKISLRKAAELIGFSHTYLWELEKEKKPLSIENLVRICESYGYQVQVSIIGKTPGEVLSWIV